MSTPEFDLDSFLSTVESGNGASVSSLDSGTEGIDGVGFKEPGYEGEIDYRIRQLSYSSLLTLHTCPRKFELYKKRSSFKSAELEVSTITFSFGHVIGEAIQNVLAGWSEQKVILQMFQGWHADLYAEDKKAKKSFWEAVIAAKKFIALINAGQFRDYELVQYQGKPAVELSFCISFPDGFRLRGYVDAVLKNKLTGEIVVLECKTTGNKNLDDSIYKNSAQAIGYSIVLDSLFPEMSSYVVLYYVYQTHQQEYTAIPFRKDHLQRALWIRELLLDIDTIKLYESAGVYPMRGESCYSFFRRCEYYGNCTLSTNYLTTQATEKEVDKEEYQINLTLMDLLDSQLAKTGLANLEESRHDPGDNLRLPGTVKAGIIIEDEHPTDGVL